MINECNERMKHENNDNNNSGGLCNMIICGIYAVMRGFDYLFYCFGPLSPCKFYKGFLITDYVFLTMQNYDCVYQYGFWLEYVTYLIQ